MKQTILTRESSTVKIRRYFMAVLKLSKSDQEFPVNLDEVYPLVYNKRSDAVDVLQKKILTINFCGKIRKTQKEEGQRSSIDYPCPAWNFLSPGKYARCSRYTGKSFIRLSLKTHRLHWKGKKFKN